MRHKPKVLIIDDDEIFGRIICDGLEIQGYEPRSVITGGDGIAVFTAWGPDVVLLDQNLPDRPGLEVCKHLLRQSAEAKIIFATAFGSFQAAVEAVKAGAYEYFIKPLEFDQFFLTVRNAVELLQLERRDRANRYQSRTGAAASELDGVSPEIQRIRKLIEQAAQTDALVLITGETGVGKGVAARMIHQLSNPEDTYLSINCAAIPESLIEAELFGYEAGAFTGATQRHKGVFELAADGTLVLDEIGEMPLLLQSKLLSVLEERRLRPLGAQTEVPVSARVIAISSRDLAVEIEAGRFRRDLYYRLAVITVQIPPLRERPGDIPHLCRRLQQTLTGGVLSDLPPDQLEALQHYPWPGNVRELRNVLERSLILADGEPRPAELLTVAPAAGGAPSSRTPDLRSLEELEKEHILNVLRYHNGNKVQAARTLGISFSTLHRRLQVYG